MRRTQAAFLGLLMLGGPTAVRAADGVVEAVEPVPTYPEIPYYLNKLKEATLDSDRIRLVKIIHDAVVNADLADKRVVKEMTPIVGKIQEAIAAGLDRAYLEGQSMWLGSAVDFFNREKLKPVVDVPEMDWAQPQTVAKIGTRISTFPDKILFHDGPKTKTASESSNIHEAVLSPDGRTIAYFRTSDDGTRAEIWAVDTRKMQRKKIASVASCLTVLFTPDSRRILFQEEPADNVSESAVYSMGTGGGKPKEITRARLLQTTVERGPMKGNIIVYRNYVHHLGTTVRECAAVMSPSGKDLGRLKNGPCR